MVKNPLANAGDVGLISGSARSPGEGNGNPLQNSCLGNPMDRGTWWATVHGVTNGSDTTLQLNNNSLFIFDCAGASWLCTRLFIVVTYCCRAPAVGERASAGETYGLQALERGPSGCGTGAWVALRNVESFWTGDWTHVRCIGRQILIHCTTREVHLMGLVFHIWVLHKASDTCLCAQDEQARI